MVDAAAVWQAFSYSANQLPGTWLRTSSAQCSTVRLNPSGNRVSPKTSPASSPTNSPATNLPIATPPQQTRRTGQRALHATIYPRQKGQIQGGIAIYTARIEAELAIRRPGVYCSGSFFGPQRGAKGRVSSAVEQRFCNSSGRPDFRADSNNRPPGSGSIGRYRRARNSGIFHMLVFLFLGRLSSVGRARDL